MAARVRRSVTTSRYSPRFNSQITISAVTFSLSAMLDRVAAPMRVPVVILLRPVTVRKSARRKSNPVMIVPETDITRMGTASGPPPTTPQARRLKRIRESLMPPRTNLWTSFRSWRSGVPRSFP